VPRCGCRHSLLNDGRPDLEIFAAADYPAASSQTRQPAAVLLTCACRAFTREGWLPRWQPSQRPVDCRAGPGPARFVWNALW